MAITNQAIPFCLWVDTAPNAVAVKCLPQKANGQLHIWNVWSYTEVDRIDAWIGNAGMFVEERNGKEIVLHCSNGIGELNLNELTVKVTFEKEDKPTDIGVNFLIYQQ